MSDTIQTNRPRRNRADSRAAARRYADRELYEARRLQTESDGAMGGEAGAEVKGFDTSAQEPSAQPRRPARPQERSSASHARRKVRRQSAGWYPSNMAIGLLCAALIIGVVIGFGITKAGEAKRIREAVEANSDDAKLEQIKESLSEGNTVLSTLRKAFTEDLIMYKDSKYVFLPINRDLKMHSYTSDNVSVQSNGEWQYMNGDKVISHKGIDVSSHQGEIDWQKVAADGVEYALIRAMYRGYGSGKLVEDTSFKANADGAAANGIKTGAYVFTQAITKAEVEEEVEMLKGLLSPYTLEGPVVVDVEQTAEGTGRMDSLDPDTRTELIKYYCELIREAGYRPMIYFNIETALLMLDITQLEDYDKWFATYNSDFYFPYDYQVWQYTDKGRVNGIEGNVDLDLIF